MSGEGAVRPLDLDMLLLLCDLVCDVDCVCGDFDAAEARCGTGTGTGTLALHSPTVTVIVTVPCHAFSMFLHHSNSSMDMDIDMASVQWNENDIPPMITLKELFFLPPSGLFFFYIQQKCVSFRCLHSIHLHTNLGPAAIH